MGLIDDIFGSKDTSSVNSNSKSSQDYADWTKGSGQKALDHLNSNFNKDKNAAEGDRTYQGDRVINDFNAGTNSAIDAVGKNAKGAAHTATDIHDMTQDKVNPYFEQNLHNNLSKMSDRLTNSAAHGGYGASDTGRVVGRELSSAMTGAMNDQWNATQDRRLKANAQEQQAYQGLNNLHNSAINASGKRDVLKQSQLDSAHEKWGENKNYDWQNLGRYIEGLNSIRSGTGQGSAHSHSTSETKHTKSPFEIVQGVAGIGASLFGAGGIFRGK